MYHTQIYWLLFSIKDKFKGINNYKLNIICIILISWLFSGNIAEPFEKYKSGKTINAKMFQSPIILDGLLDDVSWETITPISDFLQEEPLNLENPTEKTEVKIGYDNDALYVGVRLFDLHPEHIKKQLSEYDDWFEGFEGKADWFAIEIDSHHDHQSSFAFVVNASEVQADYMVFNDEEIDDIWDSVWESKVNIDKFGWTIEYRIPFSVLRFIETDNMQWGINFIRYIQRKNETDFWVTFPRGTKGVVSQYGHLTGLQNLTPKKKFEIKSYILEGMSNLDYYKLNENSNTVVMDAVVKNDFMDDIGFDLKYYVSNSSVIDFTLNPDFGQIEADPNEINLTAYETYFEENRPFFMENATQFITPLEIFYSRRIGDYGSSIIGAGKFTGKTKDGFAYNILGAVTTDSSASIQQQLAHGNRNEFYNGRVRYDILDGNSNIGAFATHFSGVDTLSGTENKIVSNVQSLDGMVKLFENKFAFDIQFISSKTTRIIDYSGYGISSEISYKTPEHFTFWVEYEKLSDSLNFDYSGYMLRNNIEKSHSGIRYRQQDPIGIFRTVSTDIQFQYAENLKGDLLNHAISINTHSEFKNYWAFDFSISHTKSHFDDLITWSDNNFNGIYNFGIDALGFVIKIPEIRAVSASLASDIRNPFYINYSLDYAESEIGDWGREHALQLDFKPTESFQVEIGIARNNSFENFHYLNNSVKPKNFHDQFTPRIFATQDDTISLFSESHNFEDVFDFRIEKSFSKQFSLSIFTEFSSSFNKLEKDSTNFKFIDKETNYNYPKPCSEVSACDDELSLIHPQNDPFFYTKYSSLISNIVFRWEFLPGSSMYIVYSKSKFINGKRFTSIEDFINYNDKIQGIELFNDESLFIKIDYWFDL